MGTLDNNYDDDDEHDEEIGWEDADEDDDEEDEDDDQGYDEDDEDGEDDDDRYDEDDEGGEEDDNDDSYDEDDEEDFEEIRRSLQQELEALSLSRRRTIQYSKESRESWLYSVATAIADVISAPFRWIADVIRGIFDGLFK